MKTKIFLRQFLPILILLLVSTFSFAQEPTSINIGRDGKVKWIHYDLINHSSVRPLTGLYIRGNGKVAYLELDIAGTQLLVNEFGEIQGGAQSPFDFKYNWDGKVEQIKLGYETIARLKYDFDGRLTQIKNESYTTQFRLKYDFDGRISGLDKGNMNYLLRFYYDFDNQIQKIKNGGYTTIYQFDYDWDDRLEGIKNSSFKWIAKVQYYGAKAVRVTDFGINSRVLIGNYNLDSYAGVNSYDNYNYNYPNNSCDTYPTGYNQNNHNGYPSGGQCGSSCTKPCCAPPPPMVTFFEHDNQGGCALNYSIGHYSSLPHEWNDKISSIQIPYGIKVIVFEHSNFYGARKTLQGNWSVSGWNDYWNDRISSIKIIAC